MNDEIKVYGFGEIPSDGNKIHKKVKVFAYLWPEDCHRKFDRTEEDTPENRLALYEKFAKELEQFEHKVILLRTPPIMESCTEFVDGTKKVRLFCRFSVASCQEEINGPEDN
jgi:hypothetical protein